MKVPLPLTLAFGAPFEEILAQFLVAQKRIELASDLQQVRFISRSIVPHVEKLSKMFNRRDEKLTENMSAYWKKSSNPDNLRLAYFLGFMPCNLYRVASVWTELFRLGFKISSLSKRWSAIELGSGPAAGACGIAAAEALYPLGISTSVEWALVEQDKQSLSLGENWARAYFDSQGFRDWQIKPFHKKIDWNHPILPRSAPSFDLWLTSFFLNEAEQTPKEIAKRLINAWDKHLNEGGLAVMIEPALKVESRKLLEIRRELLNLFKKHDGYQILLPCLGHQACGALAKSDDWCHEEVSWWRPPYLRKIDDACKLDRKTLHFSYLVVCKSSQSRETLLPELGSQLGLRMGTQTKRSDYRVVSPSHWEGKDQEFYICGDDGKMKARFRPPTDDAEINRGDLLLNVERSDNSRLTRLESLKLFIADSDQKNQN